MERRYGFPSKTFPRQFFFVKCIRILPAIHEKPGTGGPPVTRKSLTRFPLTRFLAYVRVSGGISFSRGPQYSPTNTSFM